MSGIVASTHATADGRWTVASLVAAARPSPQELDAALARSARGANAARAPQRDLSGQGCRAAVVESDPERALEALRTRVDRCLPVAAAPAPRVAFTFTGQGSQSAGMGQGLIANERFRAALERWCDALSGPGEQPLYETMYGPDASDEELAKTWNTQRALFALEASLAELWRAAGVEPAGAIGHSIGEIAAAHVAGVADARTCARLVRQRARLMAELPPGGSMLAVRASESEVATAIGAMAGIAAANGAANTVISGASERVDGARQRLEDAGFVCQPLQVSHAFHSELVEPMLERFRAVLADMRFAAPTIALASNVTGALLEQAPDPEYWARHARGCVRYAQGIQSLQQTGLRLFLELGPAPILTRLGSRSRAQGCTWLSSLDPPGDDLQRLLRAAASLHEAGLDIDWPVLVGASSA